MWSTFPSLWDELTELATPGPRWRLCAMASISVVIAVVVSLAMHLDAPWWAAISGFMSTQATRPASLQRGLLRIAGTVAGAAAGYIFAPWVASDHPAGLLIIFSIALFSSIGSLVSGHAYAVLFFGITSFLVLMSSLTDPLSAFSTAVYRVIEVCVGTGTSVLVALVLAPDAPVAEPPAAAGWSHLLGRDWPAVLHSFRTAIAVTALPLAWSFFNLPSLSQMAITVTAVMAVPHFTGDIFEDSRVVILRAFHRMLGCLLGGLAALAALGLSISNFALWLGILIVGVWTGAHVQASQRGVGYVGTQAVMAFILTLVQGARPPESLVPGFDRLIGMMLGLSILLIVTVLFWPDPETERGVAPRV